MAGARRVKQFGAAPLANNMGLFVATPSYNGRIAFSLISERAIMPDIPFFRTCIDASFADLMKAATQFEAAKTSKAKPTAKAEALKREKKKNPGQRKKKTSSTPNRTI